MKTRFTIITAALGFALISCKPAAEEKSSAAETPAPTTESTATETPAVANQAQTVSLKVTGMR